MSERIVIHPTPLDFINDNGEAQPDLEVYEPSGEHVDAAMAMRDKILALKMTRDSSSRVSRVEDLHPEGLRDSSAHALSMLDRLARAAQLENVQPVLHGFADIRSTHPAHYTVPLLGQRGDMPFVTQPAEGLTAQAADIAHRMKTMVLEGEVEDAQYLEEEGVVERKVREGLAHFGLYGYTFRHDPKNPEGAVRFADFPSCETFIAAAVMRQVEMGDSVVRLVPRTFKKKEYAARAVLRALGHDNLPVLSIGIGDTGGINKVMSWSDIPASRTPAGPVIARAKRES